MTTKYKLGEVAKWSIESAGGPQRYVDIYIQVKHSTGVLEDRKETITLPEADAIALVNSMTAAGKFVRGQLQDTVDALANGDGLSHWNPARNLVPVARVMQALAARHTAWLGVNECKYMSLNIDMRGGNFTVSSSKHNRAERYLIDMLNKVEAEQETPT